MDTKTSKAKELWLSGCKQAALAMMKTFKMGITQEDKRSLQIAHECLSDPTRESFYKSMGVCTKSEIEKATAVVESKILRLV